MKSLCSLPLVAVLLWLSGQAATAQVMESRPEKSPVVPDPVATLEFDELGAFKVFVAEREAAGQNMKRERGLLLQAQAALQRGDKREFGRLSREMVAARQSVMSPVSAAKSLPAAAGSQLSGELKTAFDRASATWLGVKEMYNRGHLEAVAGTGSGVTVLKFRTLPSAFTEHAYFAWGEGTVGSAGVTGSFWVSGSERKPFSSIADAETIRCTPAGLLLHPAPARSPVIQSVEVVGAPRVVSAADGQKSHGDIWTGTWAADGQFYVSWGDGRGFGNPFITDIGFGRLRGAFPQVVGELVSVDDNLLTGTVKDTSRNDKPSSLLAFDGRLYAHLHRPLGDPDVGYLAVSDDGGLTWRRQIETSPWTRRNESNFRCMFFINLGKGYEHNRDGYVYALGIGKEYFWADGRIYLARVRKPDILSYDRYEYLSGLPGGEPAWSPEQRQAIPLPGIIVLQQVSVAYHEGTGRYLMLTADFLFDAPSPWGPWTLADRWTANAAAGWSGGYMPAMYTQDAGEDFFWFGIAGGSMTDEADRPNTINYRLHVGKMNLRLDAARQP